MRLIDAATDYQYAILDHTAQSQRWALQKLQRFITWCAEQGITELEPLQPTDLRRFLAALRDQPSPRTGFSLSSYTIHGYAQVLKTFLNWCHEEGIAADRLARRVEMPHVDVKVIETFSPEQVKRLFAACAQAPTPALLARDRAILSVLLDTGIRASELCGLLLDNVHLTPPDAFLKVFGKGRKEREVGLGNAARLALQRYLSRYRPTLPDEAHVFLSRYQQPLTRDALHHVFRRLQEIAHIKGVRCSPHTARHTFAVNYLAGGGDIYKLSRLLGHTSVTVTEHYLRAYQARDARKDGLSVLDRLS